MRHRRFTVILMASALGALACTRETPPEVPNEDQLVAAIARLDVEAVERLLTRGADPLAPTRSGVRAIKAALQAVTGKEEDKAFPSKKFPPGDPALRIMRLVMAAVRKKSQEPYEGVGRVTLAMEMGAVDEERGRQMYGHVYVVPESGEKVEIKFSIWETDYIGIERARGGVGNPIMPVGGLVRITGTRADGIMEITRMELLEAAPAGNGYQPGTPNYLPSTWAAMLKETWLH